MGKCLNCGKELMGTRSSLKKYCDEICKNEYYGRDNPQKSVNKSMTGAIGELMVSLDLMKKGYYVLRSMSPSCPFDLIAYKDKKLKKIEVKTANISVLRGKTYYTFKKKGDYDELAVVYPDRIEYLKNEN